MTRICIGDIIPWTLGDSSEAGTRRPREDGGGGDIIAVVMVRLSETVAVAASATVEVYRAALISVAKFGPTFAFLAGREAEEVLLPPPTGVEAAQVGSGAATGAGSELVLDRRRFLDLATAAADVDAVVVVDDDAEEAAADDKDLEALRLLLRLLLLLLLLEDAATAVSTTTFNFFFCVVFFFFFFCCFCISSSTTTFDAAAAFLSTAVICRADTVRFNPLADDGGHDDDDDDVDGEDGNESKTSTGVWAAICRASSAFILASLDLADGIVSLEDHRCRELNPGLLNGCDVDRRNAAAAEAAPFRTADAEAAGAAPAPAVATAFFLEELFCCCCCFLAGGATMVLARCLSIWVYRERTPSSRRNGEPHLYFIKLPMSKSDHENLWLPCENRGKLFILISVCMPFRLKNAFPLTTKLTIAASSAVVYSGFGVMPRDEQYTNVCFQQTSFSSGAGVLAFAFAFAFAFDDIFAAFPCFVFTMTLIFFCIVVGAFEDAAEAVAAVVPEAARLRTATARFGLELAAAAAAAAVPERGGAAAADEENVSPADAGAGDRTEPTFISSASSPPALLSPSSSSSPSSSATAAAVKADAGGATTGAKSWVGTNGGRATPIMVATVCVSDAWSCAAASGTAAAAATAAVSKAATGTPTGSGIAAAAAAPPMHANSCATGSWFAGGGSGASVQSLTISGFMRDVDRFDGESGLTSIVIACSKSSALLLMLAAVMDSVEVAAAAAAVVATAVGGADVVANDVADDSNVTVVSRSICKSARLSRAAFIWETCSVEGW